MGACTAFIFAALLEFTLTNYLWRKGYKVNIIETMMYIVKILHLFVNELMTSLTILHDRIELLTVRNNAALIIEVAKKILPLGRA